MEEIIGVITVVVPGNAWWQPVQLQSCVARLFNESLATQTSKIGSSINDRATDCIGVLPCKHATPPTRQFLPPLTPVPRH